MDKAGKYYKKALKKFHEGYIDEAIEFCGESVAENKKFKAAVSFKGVLFYFKGDLENARELWDFNVRLNKDVVAQKYIENTQNDDQFLLLYARAVTKINEIKISEAAKLLEECQKSDFNVINVSNQMANCLIKQGEFDRAKTYLDKVINIDKENQMARENIKMLKKYGIIERKFAVSPIMFFLVVLVVIGTSLSIYSMNMKSVKPNEAITTKTATPSETTIVKASLEPTIKPTATLTPIPSSVPTATPAVTTTPVPVLGDFPTATLKGYIDNENYEDIYNVVMNWRNKPLEDNNKALLQRADNILKDTGLGELYKIAYRYSVNKDFSNAVSYYNKVYEYGKNDYFENSLFFLASNEESLGDSNQAVKYYEEYNKTYPNGGYEDTVLYNMALIYKNIDITKAKHYAKQLSENFPDSDYNNSNMRGILSQ